jgi:group I intron endonuclease
MAKGSGVYCIFNTVTGRFYIGSAVSFPERWGAHRRQLEHGTHSNWKLLRDYKRHGIESFVVAVIETALPVPTMCQFAEQSWINRFCRDVNLYNVSLSCVTGSDNKKQSLSIIRKYWEARGGEANAFKTATNLLNLGKTRKEVASAMGCGKGGLKSLLVRNGLAKTGHSGNSNQQIEAFWRNAIGVPEHDAARMVQGMLASGYTINEVSARLGTSRKPIQRLITRHGLSHADGRKAGAAKNGYAQKVKRAGSATQLEQDQATINKLYPLMNPTQIASIIGWTPGQVWHFIKPRSKNPRPLLTGG